VIGGGTVAIGTFDVPPEWHARRTTKHNFTGDRIQLNHLVGSGAGTLTAT
jgi:hypothetical protein